MWRMKQWYLFFSTAEANEKLSQLVAELQKVESPCFIKLPQSVAVLNGESFPVVLGMILWRHQLLQIFYRRQKSYKPEFAWWKKS